jgi:sugar phosphate isomerase/epimerase
VSRSAIRVAVNPLSWVLTKSTGRGDVDWAECFRMLTTIGYEGPISVEWEDAGMDRLEGAAEAVTYLRSQLFDPPAMAFDAAFATPA